MREINLDTWPQRIHYKHFSSMDIPFYGITTSVDVTHMLALSRQRQWSFFGLCLFAVGHAVNTLESFRYRVLEDERIVLHDSVSLGYIIPHAVGTFTCVDVEWQADVEAFLSSMKKLHEEAQQAIEPRFVKKPLRNTVFVSSMPWLELRSTSHPCNVGKGYDSIPRISMGKYSTQSDGRVCMGMDMHAHHGFVAGRDMGDFFQSVEGGWQALIP